MTNPQFTPAPRKWKLMYEGPALKHLISYLVFIKPFWEGGSLLSTFSRFSYRYYLWYSDSRQDGGIHSAYYVEEDLERARKHGDDIFFDRSWLESWYRAIDEDCQKVEVLMQKYPLHLGISPESKKAYPALIPEMLELAYRLVSFLRCSQPQLTDALKEKLYALIRSKVDDVALVESIFLNLTLPEEKSLFTHEEIDWLVVLSQARQIISSEDIGILSESVVKEKYPAIAVAIRAHFEKYQLVPASERSPAWHMEHFYAVLNTSLQTSTDFDAKRTEIEAQYRDAIRIKKMEIEKYSLPDEALDVGQRIAKVGYYRFKSGFYWRWMGYYSVLICDAEAPRFGLSSSELQSMTESELLKTLNDELAVEREELALRVDAELYLHYEGKDYIWWGDEARAKYVQILGQEDYSKIVEIKGEVASKGLVTGTAFVFYWSDDVSKKMREMPPGSILVAPQTHPTYMPAIRLAKALVCDEGGVTGHAAIVSRELKKPCVIGLHIGTKVIRTGDEIEVDANKGIVKILKRAP